MNFSTTEEQMKSLVEALGSKEDVKIYIENVGYQQAFVEVLVNQGYAAEGVAVNSASKRERLMFISHLVRTGKVLFPKKGAEDLISQLIGFGIESHDDLADAFSLLVKKAREDSKEQDQAVIVNVVGDFYGSRSRVRGGLYGRRDWAEEEEDRMFPYLSSDRRWRIGG